jgi:hypothetical protein
MNKYKKAWKDYTESPEGSNQITINMTKMMIIGFLIATYELYNNNLIGLSIVCIASSIIQMIQLKKLNKIKHHLKELYEKI